MSLRCLKDIFFIGGTLHQIGERIQVRADKRKVKWFFGEWWGVKTLISKKSGSSFPKIAAAAILLGPKKLRVLVMSQCDITRHELSDGSWRILELLGRMYSTYFWFTSYIPPINNKLGPTTIAPMASKNLDSKTIGSSIQSSFEISGAKSWEGREPTNSVRMSSSPAIVPASLWSTE